MNSEALTDQLMITPFRGSAMRSKLHQRRSLPRANADVLSKLLVYHFNLFVDHLAGETVDCCHRKTNGRGSDITW